MSYDITIAAHAKPGTETVRAWAGEHGLEVVAASQANFFIVRRPGQGDAGRLCDVSGPDPAESEDFEEELAAACLSPRWMLQVSTTYPVSKANLALCRSLARHIAEHSDGAAFDPQADGLLWPRGKQRRSPPRARDEQTSMLRLEWFVAPSRWRNAVDNIIPLLTRRCPEALPTRYGEWEPPPHRFDRSDPAEFVEFVANGKKGNGFWYASRPSFGGSFSAPHADKYARGEDQRFRIGHIELTFDGRPIAADERWREAVVDLFIRGAELFRAFFGAAQLEPGWVVSRGNRPFVAARSLHDRDYLLRGRLWQGLPPVPLWLSWYGDPYRGLVTDAVHGRIKPPVAHDGRSLLKVFASRQIEGDPSDVEIKEGDVGIAVRLARDPLPRPQLPRLDLPDELTYKERRAIDHPGGGRESNRAKPEDRAAVIPELDVN